MATTRQAHKVAKPGAKRVQGASHHRKKVNSDVVRRAAKLAIELHRGALKELARH